MKTRSSNSLSILSSGRKEFYSRTSPRNARAGFTITEIVIASGLFSLVIIGSILAHVTGLKLCATTQTKLRAVQTARAAINRTREDIRSATTIQVGNGGATNFSFISSNQMRIGNAIRVYPTDDTNVWIRYYLDTSNQVVKRIASDGHSETIANYVTNKLPFAAEDYAGNALTNDQNNRVIRMTLEIYQWEFASENKGGSNSFDYYRIQSKVARRAL